MNTSSCHWNTDKEIVIDDAIYHPLENTEDPGKINYLLKKLRSVRFPGQMVLEVFIVTTWNDDACRIPVDVRGYFYLVYSKCSRVYLYPGTAQHDPGVEPVVSREYLMLTAGKDWTDLSSIILSTKEIVKSSLATWKELPELI